MSHFLKNGAFYPKTTQSGLKYFSQKCIASLFYYDMTSIAWSYLKYIIQHWWHSIYILSLKRPTKSRLSAWHPTILNAHFSGSNDTNHSILSLCSFNFNLIHAYMKYEGVYPPPQSACSRIFLHCSQKYSLSLFYGEILRIKSLKCVDVF